MGAQIMITEVTERAKVAAQMVSDFEKFLEKQGFLLGCIMMLDANDHKSIFSGAVPVVILCGRTISQPAAAGLLKWMGESADEITKGSHLIKGDGSVIHKP